MKPIVQKTTNPLDAMAVEDKMESVRGKCWSCKFLDSSKGERPFCRRYPASLVVQNGTVQALFPVVSLTEDFCGEYVVLDKLYH